MPRVIAPEVTWKDGELNFALLAVPDTAIERVLQRAGVAYRPREGCLNSLTRGDTIEVREKGIPGGHAVLGGRVVLREYALRPLPGEIRHRALYFVIGMPLAASRFLGVKLLLPERLREEPVVMIIHAQYI